MTNEERLNSYVIGESWNQLLYLERFVNLAVGMIGVENLAEEIPESFIVKTLINEGRIGKLRNNGVLDGFYIATPDLLTRYGRPQRMDLTDAAGVYIGQFACTDEYGKAKDVVELRANADCYPLIWDIVKTAQMMAKIDNAILANIASVGSSDIIPVADKATEKAIIDAYQKKNLGAPAVTVLAGKENSPFKQAIGEVIHGSQTPYVADRLNDLYGAIETAQLKRIGVLSANEYKRERVQSAEVNAGAAEVIDWVYMTIDQFNKDAESAGIEERLYFKGAASAYDPTDIEMDDTSGDIIEEREEDTTVRNEMEVKDNG